MPLQGPVHDIQKWHKKKTGWTVEQLYICNHNTYIYILLYIIIYKYRITSLFIQKMLHLSWPGSSIFIWMSNLEWPSTGTPGEQAARSYMDVGQNPVPPVNLKVDGHPLYHMISRFWPIPIFFVIDLCGHYTLMEVFVQSNSTHGSIQARFQIEPTIVPQLFKATNTSWQRMTWCNDYFYWLFTW